VRSLNEEKTLPRPLSSLTSLSVPRSPSARRSSVVEEVEHDSDIRVRRLASVEGQREEDDEIERRRAEREKRRAERQRMINE
jgi:hypothetical protein